MSGLRIADAIDMHCHFGPDIATPNTVGMLPGVTALAAVQQARDSGHKAIVLKSHTFASVQLATTLEEVVPGIRVFGGICTDYPTGGLNVRAVEVALAMGAKIVWLPTVHSHQDWLKGKGEYFCIEGEGLKVLDENASICPSVREIFDLVVKHDAILATGHTTAVEHYAVVKEFARRGRLLVTHAGEELAGPNLSAAQCKELADLGATIELTALLCASFGPISGRDPLEVAKMIEQIGYERCTLATDYGFADVIPTPVRGMQDFLENLWNVGVKEDHLVRMVSLNPQRLLGLA